MGTVHEICYGLRNVCAIASEAAMRSTHPVGRITTIAGAALIVGSLVYGVIGPLDQEHLLVIMIVWIVAAALLLVENGAPDNS